MINKGTMENAIRRIRQSDEVGEGSCTDIDECYSDEELAELITELMENKDNPAVEEIFQEIVGMQELRDSYAEDIRNA